MPVYRFLPLAVLGSVTASPWCTAGAAGIWRRRASDAHYVFENWATKSSTDRPAASGILVLLTVLKVFLFDMAELEGVLRAASFMGLGVCLIGIGLFYQRVLGRVRAPTVPAEGQGG